MRVLWLTFIFAVAAWFASPGTALAQGYSPAEAAKKMKVADGFEVQLVASEPMIKQPVCIEFDDRGRLWCIQYLQYPNPAGLKRVKVDRYSRTVYDKVPEPPPRGPKGADRITILEDTNADGIADKAHDFVNDLNLASGLAIGHGGVFVLQVPYLLFYPDKNGDDIPDGDPEVCLTGFGMEDSSSVANSLTWGPDGWLYGCQGSCVTANIRDIEFQQGIWRYHPVSKRFELFMEGGGNEWGMDFDDDGNIILSTNYGGYRMMHGVQGGYFWKSFGKHGALHNPYAYGFFDHVPYKNFTGGHVCDGGIVYQGDSFPETFRGKFIANDLLGHAVQWHNMEKSGSTFTASFGGELINSNDPWFAPTDLTMGPDGALYVSDWYDKRTAHPDPDADWDTSNGRIYRIQSKTAVSPKAGDTPALPSLSTDKLIELLSSKNDWFVRHASRLLGERHDVTVYPKLRAEVFETKEEHLALESLWALYASGGADEAFLNDCLDHSSGKIRSWAVRLLGDQEQISLASIDHLLKVAETELDVMVRSQLACTAKRLPAKGGLQIASTIVRRDLDAKDAFIPLLLWWAVEKHSVEAVPGVLDLFASNDAWKSALNRETILPRLIRRYAAEGSEQTLTACAHLLETAPQNKRAEMLSSLAEGFSEQAKEKRITKIEGLPGSLTSQLTNLWAKDSANQTLLQLLASLSFKPADQTVRSIATNKEAPADVRASALGILSDVGAEPSFFLKLALSADEPEKIKVAALQALQQNQSAAVASALLAEYSKMTEPLRAKTREVLLGRKTSALALLQQIDAGKIAAKDFSLDEVRKIPLHQDKQLDELARKFWGNISAGTPEEKLNEIRRINNDLRAFSGNPMDGRDIFLKTCAPCHELFGEGEKVGPELTHANRGDRDFLMTSIVDPNAVIRKEFLNYSIETTDGQVCSGLIVEQNASSVTLVAAKNERTTIPRSKIKSIDESTISLMPEGLLAPLKPQELRDLFAYLQSPKPLEIKKPSAQNNLEKIKVTGKKFVGASSGKEFTPIGFNYDRDYKSRLLEDYWDAEWQTVAEDFREMKTLGANVVRIHLQFARFMDAPDQPNQKSFGQLQRLLKLAEETGLYLDVTGLACYRQADVPAWYDGLAENERWTAQANFWRAIAKNCSGNPAVFCYNLVNEPVFPAKKMDRWLYGELGGFVYGQTVTRDPADRTRTEIAHQWSAKLIAAIREQDKATSITIGLLPWEGSDVIGKLASELDYISVHLYPKSNKLEDDLKTLARFSVGKPVVIEELFPMNCSGAELAEFIERSKPDAAGWISFYWGETPEQLHEAKTITAATLRAWLDKFPGNQRSLNQLTNR